MLAARKFSFRRNGLPIAVQLFHGRMGMIWDMHVDYNSALVSC